MSETIVVSRRESWMSWVNVRVAAYAPLLGLVLMVWAVLVLVSVDEFSENRSSCR